MALEFKNMATVDVVESVADEATVLIEEGGVIKRAPKSEVGGKSKWDAIFVVDDVYNISADTVHLTSGSFNAIKAKIDANDLPRVLVVNYFEYGDSMKACSQAHIEYNITDDAFNIYYHTNWMINDSYSYGFSIASDGTISGDKY